MIKTERACQEVVRLRYDIRPNCASYNRGLWENFTLSNFYQNELVISFPLTKVLASISWLTHKLLLYCKLLFLKTSRFTFISYYFKVNEYFQ